MDASKPVRKKVTTRRKISGDDAKILGIQTKFNRCNVPVNTKGTKCGELATHMAVASVERIISRKPDESVITRIKVLCCPAHRRAAKDMVTAQMSNIRGKTQKE